MLTRLLDTFRVRANGAAPPSVASPAAPRAAGGREGEFGPLPPEGPLPHPSAMTDAWRRRVAETALALRERYPAAGDARARAEREHVERLLVRLATNADMVVRQPPPAAQEALSVAGDPQCELSDLVHVVERDPAVVRGLMRHASSVMFAAAGPPASLDDAVRRLGAKGVQVAVLAGLAEALLQNDCAPYGQDAEAVWGHMVRLGPLARSLARGFDVPTHEAFLLGLLHDVGKLVLFDLVASMRQEFRRPVTLPEGLAGEAMRDLHEPIGGLALLRWGVDPRAAWAVAHHHRREAPASPDRRSELLYVAERLDAARVRRRPVEVARWADDGALTVPVERIEAAVARA